MKYYIIDSFADEVFKGNPTAVCILEKNISHELMQNIAMENNISETVFTIKNGNNYDVYWFTPKCEIDFCGHAVLAVAYAILNFAEKESNEVSLNTKEGILTIRKKDDLYEMDTPNYDLKPIEITSDIIEAIGGIKPLEAYIGRDIVCVLEDENQVINVKPNLEIIKKLDGLLFHITSDVKDKQNNQYDSITRTFGPKLDADEVDVCGSGHCHIIPLLSKKLNKDYFTAFQASPRTGVLYCDIKNNKLKIAGKACLYCISEIFI